MSRKKTPINPEMGKRLKDVIIKSGMTQAKVAEKVCTSTQHLSNVICGRRTLTMDFAQLIKEKAIPSMRIQYVMCMDDFKTEEEKDAHSRAVWEENQAAEEYFDKIFHCFIDSIEDESGYGFHSQGSNHLIGDYIVVTDDNDAIVGVVTVEDFNGLRDELKHYSSYLIHLLIKNKMMDANFNLEKREG